MWWQVIKLDPTSAETYTDIGTALLERKELRSSLLEYERALRPPRPRCFGAKEEMSRPRARVSPLYIRYGTALQTDDNRGAAAAYREAIKLAPAWSAPYRNLGLVEYEEGRSQAALAFYEQVSCLEKRMISATGHWLQQQPVAAVPSSSPMQPATARWSRTHVLYRR